MQRLSFVGVFFIYGIVSKDVKGMALVPPQLTTTTSKTATTTSSLATTRRQALLSSGVVAGAFLFPHVNIDNINNDDACLAWAATTDVTTDFENTAPPPAATTITTTPSSLLPEHRDRKNNKDALIREDYWYQTGRLPPRVLTTAIQSSDNVQWNAFGSCTSADGGNPCTYVSLQQRATAYTKYGRTIAAGGQEYQTLGNLLRTSSSSASSNVWKDKDTVLLPLIRQDLGAATIDAELKMILLATALLVSPNFPTPNKELLVARFYANEVHAAHSVLRQAIEQQQDASLAVQAWEFGKDSWNSYFQVVNRSISPKVGDPFVFIT
jgi:hypothetical protein